MQRACQKVKPGYSIYKKVDLVFGPFVATYAIVKFVGSRVLPGEIGGFADDNYDTKTDKWNVK